MIDAFLDIVKYEVEKRYDPERPEKQNVRPGMKKDEG